MCIDNKDLIMRMLQTDYENNSDCIYLVQCLQRKKDGNENDNIPVFQHTIDNINKAERIIDRAIKIADEKNARVYISISPKDKNACLLKMAQECINLNVNNSIGKKSLESVLYGVIAKCGISTKQRLLFDFDISINSIEATEVINFFDNLSFEIGGLEYFVIPTVNGFHVISEDYKYVNDFVINFMNNEVKNVFINTFAINNHKTFDECKNMNFKQILANAIHRESAGTLVYFGGKN